MTGLTRKVDAEACCYPVRVASLDALLVKVIHSGRGYRHTYALRRNIAYNLQHIEFLDRCLMDLKLSSVLITQTWKTMIIVGCGIIESLLHFLIVARGLRKETEWEEEYVATGNPHKVAGKFIRIDSHVYARLSFPRAVEMTFDSMLKKAESKYLLGSDHSVYAALKRLRPMRNRVHLQEIGGQVDTDWNAFQYDDVSLMAEVIYKVFTSNIFHPSGEERAFFDYLCRYFEGAVSAD